MKRRWSVYLFIIFRLIVILIFLTFLLAPSYFKELFSLVLTRFHSPSYISIYRAITIFRTLNNLYVPVVILLLALPTAYALNLIVKRKRIWMDALVLAGLSYGVFSFFFLKLPYFYLFAYFILSYLAIALNKFRMEALIAKNKALHHGISWLFVSLPFFGEMVFPSFLLFNLRSSGLKVSNYFSKPFWDRLVHYTAIAISANLLISVFTFWNLRTRIFEDFNVENRFRNAERIIDGDYYSMNIDPLTHRLFATEISKRLLYIFDLSDRSAQPQKMKIGVGELQDIRMNDAKREFYYFDRAPGFLMVYDVDTLQLKRRSFSPLGGTGSARIAFDNRSGTIVVTREFDLLWILDMESLKPLRKLEIGDRVEWIVFIEQHNRYLMTHFEKYPLMRLISPDGEDIVEIPIPETQAGIALSEQNKEFYVALPLRGEIFVYDINTIKLKRKIPTVFGVRAIAFGEKRNILVGLSMVTGYVDVIDLRTSQSVCRPFAGYYLSEVGLDTTEEKAFISSRIGGIYQLSLDCR